MSVSIGFIGVGNMGQALVRGLKGMEVHGFDLNAANVKALADECGMKPASGLSGLADKCDYLVLAVKPQHADKVCAELAGLLKPSHCLISICAGLPVRTLRAWTGEKCPVVRVMPNTPALVGAGVFAVCVEDAALSPEQKAFALKVFKPLGRIFELPEKDFDAFTAVVGSGPAYVFYFMEACIEAAVNLGLARPQATDMVKGLFEGSVKLAKESDKHLSELREMVTSPAGTTIRALIHMDRTAVRSSIEDAIWQSYLRSQELGE